MEMYRRPAALLRDNLTSIPAKVDFIGCYTFQNRDEVLLQSIADKGTLHGGVVSSIFGWAIKLKIEFGGPTLCSPET